MAAKAIDSLDVYISGRRVGELNQIQGGRLSFVYDDAWMNGRVAIPLSLSMPTIAKSYDGGKPTVSFGSGAAEIGARTRLNS